MVTAGADARIAIWTAGRQRPIEFFDGHRAPIVSTCRLPRRHEARICIVGPHGSTLVARDGAQRVLEGHTQNVNGVAFAPDGRSLVSVGYDLGVRIWPLPDGPPGYRHAAVAA